MNVRSVAPSVSQQGSDDRTTRARIRDAAIDLVAADGPAALSARRVADAVGVSPGSVIHHFGSMDGLRSACDEYVASLILDRKSAAMDAGPSMDILQAFREADVGTLGGYLAAVLTEDSPAVARLVDALVDDAVAYIEQGVASGMLQPSDDTRGRAVILVLWSLGGLVLHRHMHRLLGVDLTDPDVGTSPSMARYVGPVYDLVGRGIFTEDLAQSISKAVDDLAATGEDER
jgi:AcrR family transcriptional regulator